MDYPYPIKDWKNAEQYKDIQSFAWEFLRRNAGFQRGYDDSVLDEGSYEATFDGFMWADNKQCRENLLMESHLDKFNLHYMSASKLHPDCDYSEAVLFKDELSFDFSLYKANGRSVSLKPSSMTEVVVKFDISSSRFRSELKIIKTMLDSMVGTLESHSGEKLERVNIPNAGLLSHYLRVLDADASGCDKEEIYSLLYPDLENTHEKDYPAKDRFNKQKESSVEWSNSWLKIAMKEADDFRKIRK